MNTAAYQACNLVLCARTALKAGKKLAFRHDPRISTMQFELRNDPRQSGRGLSVLQWFERMQLSGVRDFRLYLPAIISTVTPPGDGGQHAAQIVCIFPDRADVFAPQWHFDPALGVWHVTYTQTDEPMAPDDPDLQADDNSLSFARTLGDIAEFASEISCGSFAEIFNAALGALKGSSSHPPLIPLQVPLPDTVSKIYDAADLADVFGDTGSWVDLPPREADQHGEFELYMELTNRLFTEQRRALMYAVNSVTFAPAAGTATAESAGSGRLMLRISIGILAAAAAALVLFVALS